MWPDFFAVLKKSRSIFVGFVFWLFSRRFVSEARMRRLKKMMLPLLLALKMKIAVMLPIFFSALMFVAIKGVMAGLFAILLSGEFYFFIKFFSNRFIKRRSLNISIQNYTFLMKFLFGKDVIQYCKNFIIFFNMSCYI